MILAALFAVVTLVILPGVFLGYASLYRISRQEFFRACGQNLWRFVRLADFACHRCRHRRRNTPWNFSRPGQTRRCEFLREAALHVHLIGFTLIFLVLTKIRIWFDFSRKRTW